MEIGLQPDMPTYSGGLGVLAGDTIRTASDMRVPFVAVTLLYRRGYLRQRLGADGWQFEEPVEWAVEDFLKEMPQRVLVMVEDRTVHLRAWAYEVVGISGHTVPVYFLDADLPENSEWDRTLTDHLYGSDEHYRLCQELILGMGGVRMLRALGYRAIERFHMNEGHAALLTVELLYEEAQKAGRTAITNDDFEAVRKKCVFTTHTPVLAGHDQFPMDLVSRVLSHRKDFVDRRDVFCVDLVTHALKHEILAEIRDVFRGEDALNMTYLALNMSHYVNGVAKRHGEISRTMFGGYSIDSITNGVHAATWTHHSFQELFDRYIPGWRIDNSSLRYALSIPKDEIWNAHQNAKKLLIDHINQVTDTKMDPETLTIGFARRATAYKRSDLLFMDVDRLKNIASRAGALQFVYGGKAHPQDQNGKELIKRIFYFKQLLKNEIKIVYLENYDMELAKMITSGVDIWLNTPQPPLEASGTSGMKAALNGVPSLSILDGWWIEGHIEGVNGWSIGEDYVAGEGRDGAKDARSLYDKLESDIVPMFYVRRDQFIDVMRHAIALNGSFFNSQRMLQQYVLNAYFI